MSSEEELDLRHSLDNGLVKVWAEMRKTMQQIRVHIRDGEYHAATQLMTELTTTQANLSMDLRSIFVKNGFIAGER